MESCLRGGKSINRLRHRMNVFFNIQKHKLSFSVLVLLFISFFMYGASVSLSEAAQEIGAHLFWDPISGNGVFEKNGHKQVQHQHRFHPYKKRTFPGRSRRCKVHLAFFWEVSFDPVCGAGYFRHGSWGHCSRLYHQRREPDRSAQPGFAEAGLQQHYLCTERGRGV